MPDYEKLYYYLFNRITDALAQLEAGNTAAARAVLVSAQQGAEAMYDVYRGKLRRITRFALTNAHICDNLP